MAKPPLRNDLGRDRMWVGKGAALPWLIIAAIGAAAFVAMQVFG